MMYVRPARLIVLSALPHFSLGALWHPLLRDALRPETDNGTDASGGATTQPALILTSSAQDISKKIFEELLNPVAEGQRLNKKTDSGLSFQISEDFLDKYYGLIRDLIGIPVWKPTILTDEDHNLDDDLENWSPNIWNIPEDFESKFQAWSNLAIPFLGGDKTPDVLQTQFGIAKKKDDLLELFKIDNIANPPTEVQIKQFLDDVDSVTISLLDVFWQNNAETDNNNNVTYQGFTWDEYHEAINAFRQAAMVQNEQQNTGADVVIEDRLTQEEINQLISDYELTALR